VTLVSSRYQKSRSIKRPDVPYGWTQDTRVDARPERVIALFDGVSDKPYYDGNESAWDPILELLNLPLCYQPAIAQVLTEGRWRGKENAKAYVATAAYRQGLKRQLKEFPNREFKVIKAGECRGDLNRSFAPIEDHNHNEKISDRDGVGDSKFPNGFPVGASGGQRHNGKPVGVGDYGHGDDQRQIPGWLQHKEEPDRVDWDLVAKHAALKPNMVPALALALNLRFRDGVGRDEARRRVANVGLAHKVEAAYKWIDRKTKTRIAPLLKIQEAPAPDPVAHTERKAFTPPWEALRKASRAGVRGVQGLLGCPRPAFHVAGKAGRLAGDGGTAETDLYVPILTPPPGLKVSWSRSWYGLRATICEVKTGREEEVYGDEIAEVIGLLRWLIGKWKDGQDIFEDDWDPEEAPIAQIQPQPGQ
jgi:hypothetical protein